MIDNRSVHSTSEKPSPREVQPQGAQRERWLGREPTSCDCDPHPAFQRSCDPAPEVREMRLQALEAGAARTTDRSCPGGPDVAPPPETRGGRGAETLCSCLHGASPVRRNEPASGPSSRRGLRAQPHAHVLTVTPARRQPPLSPALRRGGRVTGACADRPRPQLGVWPGPTASPLLIHASALEKSPHRGALSVPV